MIFFRWKIEVIQCNETINTSLKREELLKPNSAIVSCIENERVTPEDHFQVSVLKENDYQ